MPCSDPSSGLNIRLTPDERFHSYEFVKITCSRPIGAETGLSGFCQGKTLDDILSLQFEAVRAALGIEEDEPGFILRLELDALKAGIARYLGVDDLRPDFDRYQVSAIEQGGEFIDIFLVILPPKDLPSVKSCGSMKKSCSSCG